MPMQRLDQFRLPAEFRGRSAFVVQLWWGVQATLFRCSPQFAYGFRRMLLRAFGAQVGIGVLVRPSTTITYPWKVKIGDYAWIGDDAVIYSLAEIEIGAHTVISQRTYLCAGDHDYRRDDFPIRGRAIRVGAHAWVATDVFIAPGVSIGSGAVIGARSSVFSDLPESMICYGSPCVARKARVFDSGQRTDHMVGEASGRPDLTVR